MGHRLKQEDRDFDKKNLRPAQVLALAICCVNDLMHRRITYRARSLNNFDQLRLFLLFTVEHPVDDQQAQQHAHRA